MKLVTIGSNTAVEMTKECKDTRGNEDHTSIFRSKEVKAFLLLPARLHVVIDGVWSN